MIWFSCTKCSKTHSRPDNSAGSMLFCECGQGITVPWESTMPEPPPQESAAPPPGMPRTPTLAPLTFDAPAPAPPRPDEPPGRRRRNERRDPNFCFNHTSTPRSVECEDCGEPFCSACVVAMDGATLCGPCKNFRVRGMEVPPRASTSAIFSIGIAFVFAGLLCFCLLPFGHIPAVGILSLIVLVPQLVALALGIRALYLVVKEGRSGGQALAIAGVTAASLTIVLTVAVNLYTLRVSI